MKQSLIKTFGIARLLPKISKPSATPGTVSYMGEIRKDPVKLHLIDYSEKELDEMPLKRVSECRAYKERSTITWLDITGMHDETVIHDVGETFDIHPLVLEDIANTTQRPKLEEYDDFVFTVVKMASFRAQTQEVLMEQVGLIIGKGYVVSFQERAGDLLEGVRKRLRSGKGKIRKSGSDYLGYAILDAIVDHYFSVLEEIGEAVEGMESRLLKAPDRELPAKIHRLKQELMFLRKSIWPMREVVSALQRSEHDVIQEGTAVYLRDVYDHAVQVAETVETLRDMTSGMLDLYISFIGNRTNEVMKVLTIFAAVFIPLTFIAGVYGMNFEFIPELKWRYAYFVWWIFVIVLGVAMVLYFRRKKWM